MSQSRADTLPDPEVLRAAMEPLFGDLRAFMDRRISEVSAEVSASVQLLGMSEENLASQISSVHERIAGMISAPQPGNRTSGQENPSWKISCLKTPSPARMQPAPRWS